MTKPKKSAALEVVKLCCRVLDDRKATDLKVLDVSAQSSLTDYLILATATSEPHLRALRIELEKALDSSGSRIVGIEMAQESGWVVVDVFDVMIHLFLPAMREHYSLDRLWSDSTEVALDKVLATAVAKKPVRRRAKPPAASRAKKRTKRPGSM